MRYIYIGDFTHMRHQIHYQWLHSFNIVQLFFFACFCVRTLVCMICCDVVCTAWIQLFDNTKPWACDFTKCIWQKKWSSDELWLYWTCLTGNAKQRVSAPPLPLPDGQDGDADPFADEEDVDLDIVDDPELDQTWTTSHAIESRLLLV